MLSNLLFHFCQWDLQYTYISYFSLKHDSKLFGLRGMFVYNHEYLTYALCAWSNLICLLNLLHFIDMHDEQISFQTDHPHQVV